MSAARVLRARLDGRSALVEADEDFVAWNDRAGGGNGAPLAIVPLARLASLARRLGVAVDRTMQVADDEVDIDAWVVAEPSGEDVTLAVTVLRERDPWRAPHLVPAALVPPPESDWYWEVDADLRLVHVGAGEQAPADAAALLGQPLSAMVTLAADARGTMPLLDAVIARGDFAQQPGTLVAGGAAVVLSGSARRDRAGGFAGFVGGATVVPSSVNPAANDASPPTGQDRGSGSEILHHRLDRILRGPLGRIVANADSINACADGPLDAHYVDYAADIGSAARHLLGLVDDLADLEAIERDDFSVAAEEIDLADVARRAAGLLGVRAGDAGVTIDRAGLDQPLPARGEFRRTLQILVNLMTNALRYSPRGATVWIRLQRDGERVVAIIADQGKGIDVADQHRIFEKFERVDVNEPGGSGLGLYIARRLARAMGGDLVVDSAPNQGARFILSLPAA